MENYYLVESTVTFNIDMDIKASSQEDAERIADKILLDKYEDISSMDDRRKNLEVSVEASEYGNINYES